MTEDSYLSFKLGHDVWSRVCLVELPQAHQSGPDVTRLDDEERLGGGTRHGVRSATAAPGDGGPGWGTAETYTETEPRGQRGRHMTTGKVGDLCGTCLLINDLSHHLKCMSFLFEAYVG